MKKVDVVRNERQTSRPKHPRIQIKLFKLNWNLIIFENRRFTCAFCAKEFIGKYRLELHTRMNLFFINCLSLFLSYAMKLLLFWIFLPKHLNGFFPINQNLYVWVPYKCKFSNEEFVQRVHFSKVLKICGWLLHCG